MKKVMIACLAAVCLCTWVYAQGEGERPPFDNEERIKKIAERLGITPEEVKERMKQRGRRMGMGEMVRPPFGGPGMQPGWGMRQPDTTVAVATTDKYLFVVKGNTVYQFDVNTLKLLHKALLEPEGGNLRERYKEGIKRRIEQVKRRIEELKAEGKVEEAEKLEAQLKKWLERVKERGRKGWKRGRHGGGKAKEGNKEEANKEEEVLF